MQLLYDKTENGIRKNEKERKHDMEIKRVKGKGLLCVILVFNVLLLSLYGCAMGNDKADQEQNMESGANPAGGTNTELESDNNLDAEQGAEAAENSRITFPDEFKDTIGNVTFNMDIVVDTDLTDSIVTAKAQMQKVNREKAFQLFFGDIPTYDTYDYEEEDEYGETVHQVTYVSPEETTFSYGPQSSKFDFMKRNLMPYVLTAFVPFHDERYNADLYGTETQLSFMSCEDAFETVQNALKEMNIQIEASYTGYALDYETMRSQEHHEDIDGNQDRSQYKKQWTAVDDCYYFYINQTYKGLPVYYVQNEDFTDPEDINAPIQAVVSEKGIEWLNIGRVYAISDEQDGVSLADMDSVVKTAAEQCNQLSGDAAYEVTKAELYYYVDLSSGMGTYDVKPVWILSGCEKGGKKIQIVIDAQTAVLV